MGTMSLGAATGALTIRNKRPVGPARLFHTLNDPQLTLSVIFAFHPLLTPDLPILVGTLCRTLSRQCCFKQNHTHRNNSSQFGSEEMNFGIVHSA